MKANRKRAIYTTVGALGLVGITWAVVSPEEGELSRKLALGVNPGKLSAAHAHLENDCRACHTPNKGVEAINCIVCHANNEAVLKRQPTAFHANIGSCTECHLEHEGRALYVVDIKVVGAKIFVVDAEVDLLGHCIAPADQ